MYLTLQKRNQYLPLFLKMERTFTFMNAVKNVVKFKYYDEFHCIGPDCTDSCCKEWQINLTKREYLDYKKMKCSSELRGIIDGAFKRIKEGTDSQYAKMKIGDDGKCPFLGEDSLCKLQKELGESALSLTCSVFPRIISLVGSDTVMQSCTATCSHVVELLMRHPEGLEIIEEEYNGNDSLINKRFSSGPVISSNIKEYPYFWNIINAKVDILQNRSFTIPERLLILGYFCQKADEYIKNDIMEKIPGLADMLLDNELCRKIADSLKPPYSEGRIASDSLNNFINMYEFMRTDSSEYLLNLFKRVYERLECDMIPWDGGVKCRFNVSEYLKLCETFRNMENERSYIVENLLVNLVFLYHPNRGMWGNYFDMAVFYNIMKICVPVFLPENYNDRDLALAFTYAVKMVLNTNLSYTVTYKDFIMRNQFTLPYAAFLIC